MPQAAQICTSAAKTQCKGGSPSISSLCRDHANLQNLPLEDCKSSQNRQRAHRPISAPTTQASRMVGVGRKVRHEKVQQRNQQVCGDELHAHQPAGHGHAHPFGDGRCVSALCFPAWEEASLHEEITAVLRADHDLELCNTIASKPCPRSSKHHVILTHRHVPRHCQDAECTPRGQPQRRTSCCCRRRTRSRHG